jgi:hypothetical protein
VNNLTLKLQAERAVSMIAEHRLRLTDSERLVSELRAELAKRDAALRAIYTACDCSPTQVEEALSEIARLVVRALGVKPPWPWSQYVEPSQPEPDYEARVHTDLPGARAAKSVRVEPSQPESVREIVVGSTWKQCMPPGICIRVTIADADSIEFRWSNGAVESCPVREFRCWFTHVSDPRPINPSTTPDACDLAFSKVTMPVDGREIGPAWWFRMGWEASR